MTPEERKIIEGALAAPNPTQTIPIACRNIVMERIDRMHHPDRELRFLIKDIVDASDFGCEVKLHQTQVTGSVRSETSGVALAAVCGVAALGALITMFVVDSATLRGACSIAAAALAFFAGKSISVSKIVTEPTTKTRLVAATCTKEIEAKIDKFTDSLLALFNYRQIEGTHKDFLKWLQSQYADSTSESFRRDVKRLLGRFNYSLEEYSEEKIDGFDITEANIESPQTSVPALLASNDRVLLKGHFLIPLKK